MTLQILARRESKLGISVSRDLGDLTTDLSIQEASSWQADAMVIGQEGSELDPWELQKAMGLRAQKLLDAVPDVVNAREVRSGVVVSSPPRHSLEMLRSWLGDSPSPSLDGSEESDAGDEEVLSREVEMLSKPPSPLLHLP
jgi:hypothetical protein